METRAVGRPVGPGVLARSDRIGATSPPDYRTGVRDATRQGGPW